MQEKILNRLKKISWKSTFLLGMLLLFEFSIHPLTFGPDRKIHDPAVYRMNDSGYLVDDWYTNMAVESGVYTFYARLINLWHVLPFGEETWRMLLYLASLVILYVSMIKIGRIFSQSLWVAPIVAACHALLMLIAPPTWLYGPFIQIDGGLAPRSIGMALSFLSLFFLLKGARIFPWIFLGVATLIHVSNSLIVFTLFFVAWFCVECEWKQILDKEQWIVLAKKSFITVGTYVVSGGWFALYVAYLGSGVPVDISTEKFIWTWIYFRAPYMALPLISWKMWFLFFLHGFAVVAGWYLLRKRFPVRNRKALDLLGLVGMGSILYFFLFYLFAFVRPWLFGFQFYSLRVVYFAHFVAYLFAALVALNLYREVVLKKSFLGNIRIRKQMVIGMAGVVTIFLFFGSLPGKKFLERAPKNIAVSWMFASESENRVAGVPGPVIEKYISLHLEPFLAPPNWYGSFQYFPSVAPFKSFGFTKKGMAEWFERMNDVSRGDLERIYESQSRSGKFEPVPLDWRKIYSGLTTSEVASLSKKYHFKLFLTYKDLSYPFQLVAENGEYGLYRISK